MIDRKRTNFFTPPPRLTRNHFLGGAVALLSFVALAAVYAQASLIPEIKRDIPYAKTQGQTLLLDLYRVENTNKPAPLVVCIHGGGWCAGSKADVSQMADGLARLGYCAVGVNYRLAPQAHFPEPLTDVKTAIKFMKEHAREYNVDVSRIAVIGASAGAYLALMVAVTDADSATVSAAGPGKPSLAKAVISLAGPTDLTKEFPPPSLGVVEALLGKSRSKDMDAFAKASPVHYLNSSAAPMLFIHGDSDEIVPYAQAQEMEAAAKKVGASAEMFTLHHGGHSGGQSKQEDEQSIKLMIEFLAKYLK